MVDIKESHSPVNQRFERMVNLYQGNLLKICFLCLRDRALAEDAVQETFIRAYRGMNEFRRESSEKTWLTRIAINICRDMLRSAWFRHHDRRLTPDMLPEPAAPCEEKDEEITLLVADLPPKLREVVLLYYYQDFTVNEIAVILGIRQSSVSGRLKRARALLKEKVEKERRKEA